MSKLLTLTDWAKARYGDAAPRLGTLRRWARESRIFPAPRKHGRTYYVQPDAEYLDTGSLHEPSTARRLAQKLAGSSPLR